jgi:hypothetical protein
MQGREGEGRAVPLRISFVGLKSLGWISLAHNNFAPLLVLHEDHLVQKVIFRKARRYSEIERVEVSTTDTDNLDIAYLDSAFSFCCKLKAPRDLVEVLKCFAAKGVRLGGCAQRLLRAAGDAQRP